MLSRNLLSAVKPVFLMDFHDFEVYVKEIGDKKLMNISRDTYEIISGRLSTLCGLLF